MDHTVFLSASGIDESDLPQLLKAAWAVRISADGHIIIYNETGATHNRATPELRKALAESSHFQSDFRPFAHYSQLGWDATLWIHKDLVAAPAQPGQKVIPGYHKLIAGKTYYRLQRDGNNASADH